MPDLKSFEELSADHLRLILETGSIGIWELDLASGQAVRNVRHDMIFGYSERLPVWTYEMFIEHVEPTDRDRVDQLQKRAIAEGRDWNFECAIRTAGGEKRWISAAGRPLKDADGAATKLIGHVIDITSTKERESRLSLLTQELNHRVRNMLAVIKAIIRLASRRANDVPTFAASLEGRVEAIARAHELLINHQGGNLLASHILEQELAAFADAKPRVHIDASGEAELPSPVGQGLALILHELTTNALKYGALSNADGSIAVTIEQNAELLRMEWRETGGPAVEEQPEAGFGSRLIGDALGPIGKVDLRFPESGVECDININLVLGQP